MSSLRLRRCRCSGKIRFFHRGDPFSPVTHLPFVLGRSSSRCCRRRYPRSINRLRPTTTIHRHLPSLPLDLHLVDSPASASRHGFRVRRSTTPTPTNRLQRPLLVAIDEQTEILTLPGLCLHRGENAALLQIRVNNKRKKKKKEERFRFLISMVFYLGSKSV